MVIQQIYTSCLAQGAYYIESAGEAAIIDPLRESEPYLKLAEKRGTHIKYIFETHFHADFVSGHLSLQSKTDAKIIFGPLASPEYKVHQAKDGEVFKLGDISIEVIHTPGHTMESSCYLLRDETGKPKAIFTGDTLLLGDVGRPDLAQKSENMTMEELAGILFDSLRNKILPLPDDVIVYPAHGAGSACGKNMMKETLDTLGNQKIMNYALRSDMTREEFISEVTEGLMPPPAYFPANVKLNKKGYQEVKHSIDRIHPKDIARTKEQNQAIILDVRHKDDYKTKHIPGSIFIGLGGSFAPWVGELIVDVKKAIILVCPDSKIEEALTRLARVGFDHIIGVVDGGVEKWEEEGFDTDHIDMIDSQLLHSYSELNNNKQIIDVRRSSEYDNGQIDGAVNKPLSNIYTDIDQYGKDGKYIIHCQSGYRSVIACSILKSKGIHHVTDLTGGYVDYVKNKTALTQ
jgi:glyoxylase-like metal-dependent hydrolase (beta-lactamase superfamily II)/rhodanese-related sulfurtransferase